MDYNLASCFYAGRFAKTINSLDKRFCQLCNFNILYIVVCLLFLRYL